MTGRAPLPVILVTGFLGSGKTTLLNHLVKQPELSDSAVVINELGGVATDHLLIEAFLDDTVVLSNGCVCCSIRGDLADTLAGLHRRRAAGSLPPFRRVLVETTGMADPAPIAQTLLREPTLAGLYRLSLVVTTVDAAHGLHGLGHLPVAAAQVALADLVVLTKTDLAADTTALRAQVAGLAPDAAVIEAVDGALPPDALHELERHPRWDMPGAGGTAHWLGSTAPQGSKLSCAAVGVAAEISTSAIMVDDPLPRAVFSRWLNAIISLRGQDLLRIKALLNLVGASGPVVVHGIRHFVHPMTELPAWPGTDKRSRIVVIARNIPEAALASSLEALRQYSNVTSGFMR